MLDIFKDPVSVIPGSRYKNFTDSYNNTLDTILVLEDILYVRNDNLFLQLVKQLAPLHYGEDYYQVSVDAVSQYLRNNRFTASNVVGETKQGILFPKPVKEGVMYSTDLPGMDKYLGNVSGVDAYRPVHMVYHPFTNLKSFFFDGRNLPINVNGDNNFVFFTIDVPQLVLQYQYYCKEEKAFDRVPNNKHYVSKHLLMPLIKQYGNIALFNRFANILLDEPLTEFTGVTDFKYTFYNDRVLDQAIPMMYNQNKKFKPIHILKLAPSIDEAHTFFNIPSTAVTLNNRPFLDLSRLELTIKLFKLIPSQMRLAKSRGDLTKLKVYIKRVIGNKVYMKYLGKDDYSYYLGKLNELIETIEVRR